MTDVVTGDDSFRSFYGMPSKQANMVWVDEAWAKPVILRPGFQSKTWLLTVFLNHAGPLVVNSLPQKKAMTSGLYTGTVLPKVVAALEQ